MVMLTTIILHLMRYNCRNCYYNTPSMENVYIFETILWLWAGDTDEGCQGTIMVFLLPEKQLLARNLLKGNFEVCLVTNLVGERNQSHLKWLPVDRFFFVKQTTFCVV